MKRKLLFVLTIGLFQLTLLYSQTINFKKRLIIEGFYHYGFVPPHHDVLKYFINTHIQSYQFNLGLRTFGNKYWQYSYNYPVIGIGYHHSNLGNNDVFGKLNAIYFFIDRYYFKHGAKNNLGNRISIGTGYITKPFDLYKNPFNMAFSKHFNIYVNYSLELDFRLNNHTSIKTGLSATHISNGNIRKPNLGLNSITLFTGILYSLDNYKNIQYPSSEFQKNLTKKRFIITATYGLKSISRLTNILFSVYGLSGEYNFKINTNSWLGMVLTNYYDTSIPNELSYENPSYSASQSDKLRTALNLSYEMDIGKISILVQPGIYLVNRYKETGIMSNRVGARYNFYKNLYANFYIKAHLIAVADVTEWGISYKLK